jgi:hypothetical protein
VPLLQARVSHIDPLSSHPILRPATLLNSRALQPFDLSTFLFRAATQLAWVCPASGRATTVRHLARDSYFSAVFSAASALAGRGGGGGGGGSGGSGLAPGPVEVAYDGRWRPLRSGTWRPVHFPAAPLDTLAAPVFDQSGRVNNDGGSSGGAGPAAAQQLHSSGGDGGALSSMGPPLARPRQAASPVEGNALGEGPAPGALTTRGYAPRGTLPVAPAAAPPPAAPRQSPLPEAASSGAALPEDGGPVAAPAAAPSTPRAAARSEALPALTPITRQLREFASWGQRLSSQAASAAAGGDEFGGAPADPFAVAGSSAGGAGCGLFFSSPLGAAMPSLLEDSTDAHAAGGTTPPADRAAGGIPCLFDLLASGGGGSAREAAPTTGGGQRGRHESESNDVSAPRGGSAPLPFGGDRVASAVALLADR